MELKKNNYVELAFYPEKGYMTTIFTKGEEPTDEEFREYLDWLTYIYDVAQEKNAKFYQLIDSRGASKYLKSEHRISMGKFMKSHHQLMKDWNIATVFLTNGLAHKLLLQAIFAIQGYPAKHYVTNKEDDAYEWLEKQGLNVEIIKDLV